MVLGSNLLYILEPERMRRILKRDLSQLLNMILPVKAMAA